MAAKLDPKGNAVLMEFDRGGRVDALIFRGEGMQPFVYAYGYDAGTGEWDQGRYFGDPARAYFASDPEILEASAVWWTREDYRAHLREAGMEGTDSEVWGIEMETARMTRWKDGAIADGNDAIAEAVAYVYGRE